MPRSQGRRGTPPSTTRSCAALLRSRTITRTPALRTEATSASTTSARRSWQGRSPQTTRARRVASCSPTSPSTTNRCRRALESLAIYALYFYALIKLIPVTLTLPGIAGLILTIGVAADANVVIFERVKEEARAGRSPLNAITAGYKRGLSAIIDANVVTFMVAFILFILSQSDVQGFALTLGMGVLVSLFTAVAATRAILGTMGRTRLIRHRSALGVSERRRSWTFDFMGRSKWFFTLSGVILLVGAIAIGARGVNFGIDFVSGTEIQATFAKQANVGAITSAIEGLHLKSQGAPIGAPVVQQLSVPQKKGTKGQPAPRKTYSYQISTKTLQDQFIGSPGSSTSTVRGLLNQRYSVVDWNQNTVDPK